MMSNEDERPNLREGRDPRSFPESVSRWSGLRAQMTFTTVLVVLAVVVVILLIRFSIFLLLREPLRDLTVSLYIALVVPAWAPIIGAVIGLAAARSPVRRIQRLVLATTVVAEGDYGERVEVSRRDEIGQLEHHFNQMAEQLAASTAERQILVEQNARLGERTRLSRDLHDSVKQQLFAVALQVGVALSQLDTVEAADMQQVWVPLREHLAEADSLISQAQQDLTALIHQWRPVAVQEHGLAAALRTLALTWSRQHEVDIDLQLGGDGRLEGVALPEAIEDAFWHIAQEALANIARHSQATKASLQLWTSPEQVSLVIEDSGCGFIPPPSPDTSKGVGLRSMMERMAPLGGSVSIVSSPGAGTRVTVRCPILLSTRDASGRVIASSDAATT